MLIGCSIIEAIVRSPALQDLFAFSCGAKSLLPPGAVISRRTSSRMSGLAGLAEGVVTRRESVDVRLESVDVRLESIDARLGACTYLD